MRVNGGCHPDQPGAVFGNFQKVRRGKILGTVRRRVAQRLEHPGMNQRRDVVRLAVQHPASLLRRQADGQLAQERQKPMLIVFHVLIQSVYGLEIEHTSSIHYGVDSEEIMPLIREYRKEAVIEKRLLLVDQIYFRIKPSISKLVFKIAHPQWAEEVLQDTLWGILKSLDRFTGKNGKVILGFLQSDRSIQK